MESSGRAIATIVTCLAMLGLSNASRAQDAAKAPEAGCTTANGVTSGPGCAQAAGASAAGKVENGMPATQHQQDVLRPDDKATQGQNMEATGAGGGALPATEHQQEVLKQGAAGQKTGTSP